MRKEKNTLLKNCKEITSNAVSKQAYTIGTEVLRKTRKAKKIKRLL